MRDTVTENSSVDTTKHQHDDRDQHDERNEDQEKRFETMFEVDSSASDENDTYIDSEEPLTS